MSIQGRSGHIGVDFVYQGIRVPDCAVEVLEERQGVKKLDREERKRGLTLRKLLDCCCPARVCNLGGAQGSQA